MAQNQVTELYNGPQTKLLNLPKFAGSNPAEAVGFFRAKESSARLPSEGYKNRGSHVVDLRHVKDP
jgi:hypothetical protein